MVHELSYGLMSSTFPSIHETQRERYSNSVPVQHITSRRYEGLHLEEANPTQAWLLLQGFRTRPYTPRYIMTAVDGADAP